MLPYAYKYNAEIGRFVPVIRQYPFTGVRIDHLPIAPNRAIAAAILRALPFVSVVDDAIHETTRSVFFDLVPAPHVAGETLREQRASVQNLLLEEFGRLPFSLADL